MVTLKRDGHKVHLSGVNSAIIDTVKAHSSQKPIYSAYFLIHYSKLRNRSHTLPTYLKVKLSSSVDCVLDNHHLSNPKRVCIPSSTLANTSLVQQQ